MVALVGESGSGKSSCIGLLQRWYDPTEGRILLDAQPIAAYSNAALHRHMALVGQEPVLFARSIRDNIAYGCEEYGWGAPELDRRLVEAAMQAKAHGFITSLEDGYETVAGERGSQLSGGQKQRIAIARALVRDPSVLLLDEATSALDTSSEAQVQAAIDESMKGRTVVIIAHRLSTVRRAHKIVVMSNGRVIEEGVCVCVCVCIIYIYIYMYIYVHIYTHTHTHTHTLTHLCGRLTRHLTRARGRIQQLSLKAARTSRRPRATSHGNSCPLFLLHNHLHLPRVPQWWRVWVQDP